MNRREFLVAAGAYGAALPATSQVPGQARRLRAAPADVAAAGRPALAAWAYDGSVPGPLQRLRRGAVLDIELDNALPVSTTIHWHGVRMPNAMDGVPYLTQAPVAPGERFLYRFALPDSGTFWYHPHLGTPEQVDRGLYGALLVEDEQAPAVDREWVWIIDDWRLDAHGRVAEDFYDYMDVSHAGRLGQTLTVNGQPPAEHSLHAGERVRLRLINAANARIFALRFERLLPWLIAVDGNPLGEARALSTPLLLGPGMRADLIVDAVGDTGERLAVTDRFGRGERVLAWLALQGERGRPRAQRPAPLAAAPNPLPEPRIGDALHRSLVLGGGMMSMSGWPDDPWTERIARRLRRFGGSREADPVWSINGAAQPDHHGSRAPEFEVELGTTVLIRFENRTAWWHPMHLHGHSFRVLRVNGRDVPGRPWRDTALLGPRETLDAAFVADNPGDWLIHCHVLEHHAGGLGTTFRVLG